MSISTALLPEFGQEMATTRRLSVYLRLRDVPLPSIYGPTADEKWGA